MAGFMGELDWQDGSLPQYQYGQSDPMGAQTFPFPGPVIPPGPQMLPYSDPIQVQPAQAKRALDWGLFGATLQDVSASLLGRPGGNVSAVQENRVKRKVLEQKSKDAAAKAMSEAEEQERSAKSRELSQRYATGSPSSSTPNPFGAGASPIPSPGVPVGSPLSPLGSANSTPSLAQEATSILAQREMQAQRAEQTANQAMGLGDLDSAKFYRNEAKRFREIPDGIRAQLGPDELAKLARYRDATQKGRSTNVTVNNTPFQKSFGKELGRDLSKDLIQTQFPEARKAANTLRNTNELERLIDEGIYSGAFANVQEAAANIAVKAGFNQYEDKVANTQAYLASVGQQVGQMITMFGAGTGLSDADREFAERMAAGKIDITEKAIRRIVNINKSAAKNVLGQYNTKAQGVMDSELGADLPYSIIVDTPQDYVPIPPGAPARPPGFTKRLP